MDGVVRLLRCAVFFQTPVFLVKVQTEVVESLLFPTQDLSSLITHYPSLKQLAFVHPKLFDVTNGKLRFPVRKEILKNMPPLMSISLGSIRDDIMHHIYENGGHL